MCVVYGLKKTNLTTELRKTFYVIESIVSIYFCVKFISIVNSFLGISMIS